MKTTERLDRTVLKLYNAFNEGKLNAFDCKACAVGNICDNNNTWGYLRGFIGGKLLGKFEGLQFFYKNYGDEFIKAIQKRGYNCYYELYEDAIKQIEKTGYTPQEILHIEKIFMDAFTDEEDKDNVECQFNGLCNVIEYLCELEGVENITDYTKMFEESYNEKTLA